MRSPCAAAAPAGFRRPRRARMASPSLSSPVPPGAQLLPAPPQRPWRRIRRPAEVPGSGGGSTPDPGRFFHPGRFSDDRARPTVAPRLPTAPRRSRLPPRPRFPARSRRVPRRAHAAWLMSPADPRPGGGGYRVSCSPSRLQRARRQLYGGHDLPGYAPVPLRSGAARPQAMPRSRSSPRACCSRACRARAAAPPRGTALFVRPRSAISDRADRVRLRRPFARGAGTPRHLVSAAAWRAVGGGSRSPGRSQARRADARAPPALATGVPDARPAARSGRGRPPSSSPKGAMSPSCCSRSWPRHSSCSPS